MAYTHETHLREPTEDDTPAIVYEAKDYLNLDFYEGNTSGNGRSYDDVKPDNKYVKPWDGTDDVSSGFRKSQIDGSYNMTPVVVRYRESLKEQDAFDSLLHNATILENGTFINTVTGSRYSTIGEEQPLIKSIEEKVPLKATYDPELNKIATFYPSSCSTELSTAFHNDLILSGYLGITNNSLQTITTSDTNFTVGNVNLLRNFFQDQFHLLKAFDFKLDSLSGQSVSSDYNENVIRSLVKYIFDVTSTKDKVYYKDIEKLSSYILSKIYYKGQASVTGALTNDFSSLYLPRKIYDHSMTFTKFPYQALNCNITTDDGKVQKGLITDFYVAIYPVKSKMMSLKQFIEKYGIFADETKPLMSIPMDAKNPVTYTNNSSNDNVSFSQNTHKTGPFLGLSQSLTGLGKKLLINIPQNSPGVWPHNGPLTYLRQGASRILYQNDMAYKNTWFTHECKLESTLDRSILGQVRGTDKFFDFLRYAIYSNRNYYDINQLTPDIEIYYDSRKTNRKFAQEKDARSTDTSTVNIAGYSIYRTGPKSKIVNGVFLKAMTSEEQKALLDYGFLPPSVASRDLPSNIIDLSPDPLDSIFVHTYELNVAFYPKTIKTKDELTVGPNTQVEFDTTTRNLEMSTTSKHSFVWDQTNYKNETSNSSKNFYMYDVQQGKTFSIPYVNSHIMERDGKLLGKDGSIRKFERNRNQGIKSFTTAAESMNTPYINDSAVIQSSRQQASVLLNPIKSGGVVNVQSLITEDRFNGSDYIVANTNRTIDSLLTPDELAKIKIPGVEPLEPKPVNNLQLRADIPNDTVVAEWDPVQVKSTYATVKDGINHTLEVKSYSVRIDSSSDGNNFRFPRTVTRSSNEFTYVHSISEDLKSLYRNLERGGILKYRVVVSVNYEDTLRGSIVTESEPVILDINTSLQELSNDGKLTPPKPVLSVEKTGIDFATFKVILDSSSVEPSNRSLATTASKIIFEYYPTDNPKAVGNYTSLVNIDQSRFANRPPSTLYQYVVNLPLQSSKSYVVSAKVENIISISSEQSNSVNLTTKQSTKLNAYINLKTSRVDGQTGVRVTQTGVAADVVPLTDINITYKILSGPVDITDTLYGINVGPLKVTDLQPIKDLSSGSIEEDFVFVGPPGSYQVFFEPVYGSFGTKTAKSIEVTIVNRAVVAQTNYEQMDSAINLTTFELIDGDLGNILDISQPFKAKNFNYRFDLEYTKRYESRFINRFTGIEANASSRNNELRYFDVLGDNVAPSITDTNLAESLRSEFRFILQKNTTNNRVYLLCLFGPDPFSIYNVGYSEENKNQIGSQFSIYAPPDASLRTDAKYKYVTVFSKEVTGGISRFTNFYYYDKDLDTLYLQIQSKTRTSRYVSIKNLVEGLFVDNTELNFPYPIILKNGGSVSSTTDQKENGYERDYQSDVSSATDFIPGDIKFDPNKTGYYNSEDFQTKIKNLITDNNIIITDNAVIPESISDTRIASGPQAEIVTQAARSRTQPDNGFFVKLTSDSNMNYRRLRYSDVDDYTILKNTNNVSVQNWQTVNFDKPVTVLYEDSGFYLVEEDEAPVDVTAPILHTPVILSVSKNDGVGEYRGYSVVTVKLEYREDEDFNFSPFGFAGFILQKYIDGNWVEVEMSSAAFQSLEKNVFQGEFSFETLLADGVVNYRVAVQFFNNDSQSMLTGPYKEINKLFENLIAEDFD